MVTILLSTSNFIDIKYVYAFLLLFAFFDLKAQQTITTEEINNHIGDSVKLKAKIYGIKYLSDAKGTPPSLAWVRLTPTNYLPWLFGRMYEKK